MTRIGFVYNQKPDLPALRLEDGDPQSEDEPPSRVSSDDEFAEWDSAETIAAVENALAALGEVVRLEADAHFPDRLRHSKIDLAFNIAIESSKPCSTLPAYSSSPPFRRPTKMPSKRSSLIL